MNNKATDSAAGSPKMKIFIHRNGETYGPYDRKAIEGFVQQKRASLRDWVSVEWREERARLEDVLRSGETVASQKDSMDDAAVAEMVRKIENLVYENRAEHALDLVMGLGEPKLYAALLEDCWISPNGELHLSSFYWGNRIPFFLRLVGHCPEEADICRTLRSDQLTSLKLDGHYLGDLNFLRELTSLKTLHLEGGRSIKNIDALRGLVNLEDLTLKDCDELSDLSALSHLKNLRDLDLTGGASLSDLQPLSKLYDLQCLNLRGCRSLNDPEAIRVLGVSETHLPEHLMPEITLREVHQVIITKTFCVSDEFIENSPFESVEELQQAIEEGSDEWDQYSYDIWCDPDDEDTYWASESKGITHREWNFTPL